MNIKSKKTRVRGALARRLRNAPSIDDLLKHLAGKTGMPDPSAVAKLRKGGKM